MLKKAMFLTLILVVGVVASAFAQTGCEIGVYGDAGGTQMTLTPVRDLGNPTATFDVYYVIRVEDLVLGAAWYREVTGFNAMTTGIDWASYGTFLDDRTADGYGWRIGLGTCQLGFGGAAITIMKETLTILDDYQGGTGTIQVIPDGIQTTSGTAYSDCLGEVKPCGIAPALTLESVIPAEGSSFGAVKALFK
jgi:hypothetical protein